MIRRAAKGFSPAIDGLESRVALTVISPLAFGGAGLRAKQAETHALQHVLSPAAGGGAGAGNGGHSGSSIPGTVTVISGVANSSPTSLDVGSLSPAGLRRSRFLTRGTGPYAVSSPNFSSQGKEVLYIGTLASNQFLQGTMIMRIDTPSISTGLVTGFAALRDRNVASTGNVVTLDLYAPASSLDRFGRPTSLEWVVDDNDSGGNYAGAAGVGTLKITYSGQSNSKNAAGSASEVFSGNVLPTGVSNILDYTLNHFN